MFKKEALEQEYNDCAEGVIEPGKFYSKFFLFLKMFQVWDGPKPKWTGFVVVIMFLYALSSLMLTSMSFYHGVESYDIGHATEAGTKRFFLHQIETRKIWKVTVIFCFGVCIGINLFSVVFLLFYLLTHKSGEGKRPLLFPFWWFDTDFGKSPIYELAFIFANSSVQAYGTAYTFMIGTQIVWVRQIECKTDVVIWHMEDLLLGIAPAANEVERRKFDNLIRQRMREIIQHHNSMHTLIKHFAAAYKKLLMMEQFLTAPVVCMAAYSVAVSIDNGEFNVVMMLLLMAAVILLYIPSYLCTFLSDKVSSLCFTCWNIPFWNAGTVIRPYLLLIMMKSLRPLPLKVPGFQEFSVQTFSNKMASAYSFFNMLRQANKK